jgi:hypothetical protein
LCEIMPVNSNIANTLAQDAVATGGLRQPLRGQDVLETDASQLDLDALPPSEIDVLDPMVEPDTDLLQLASTGPISRFVSKGASKVAEGVGKILSPTDNTFNKAQQKIEDLQAESGKVNNLTGRLDDQSPEPALEQPAADVDDEGFGAGFDQAQQENYQAYQRGSIIRADGKSSEAVMQDLQTPAEISDKGLLDDFRAVGSAGDAKIPDEQGVLSGIQAISKTYAGQIDEAKRGEITLEVTRQMADILGTDERKLAKTILGRHRGGVIVNQAGGAGLAETMLASRDLLVREMQKLDALAKAAETGNDTDALQFRAQLELVAQLQAQIKGAQTEIARALSSFRVPARGGQAAEGMKPKDLTTLLEDFGGIEDVRDMAKAYNQQGDNLAAKAAITRAGSKYKKFTDAFYESWINILLSNPVTHMKNIIGAFLTTFAHIPETYGAATVGALRRARGGKGGVYYGEANAMMFGAMMALREAFGAAGKAFRTGERVMPGSKIEGVAGRRHAQAFSAEGMQAQNFGTAIDILGNVMTLGRIPTRALEFEDTFFKVVAHRMSLYQEGYRSGISKGKRGDALSTHIAEFVFDPPESALQQADAHAKYVTLQTDLDRAGKTLKGVRDIPAIRYFIPFLKTPYNAFKYAFLDRGPIGAFYGEGKRAIDRAKLPGASMADKAAGDMAMARLIMGNATAAMMAYLTAENLITGSGPADPGVRAALKETGWQPYSIKVGNQYVSYMGVEPFTSIMMLGADAAEAISSGVINDDDADMIVASVAAAFAHQVTDKTFMSGFSNLVSTLNDPTRYAGRTLDSFVASLVPRVVSQGERLIDPTVRAARTKVDQIRAQIPGWSSTLPPQRNLAGQAQTLGGAAGPDILSPFYSSVVGPNPSDPDPKRAERAYDMFQEFVDVRFGPSPHPDTFNSNVGLTGAEIDKFHQLAGKHTLDQYERLAKRPEYKKFRERAVAGDKLAREQLHLMLRGAIQAARAMARKDLLKDKEVGSTIRQRLEASADLQREEAQMMMGN